MSANLIPTRQELLRLRRKKTSAQRGHKLLKDKRDNLIQTFMGIFREAIKLRKEIDTKYVKILNRFDFALLDIDDNYFDLLAENPDTSIDIAKINQNVLGIQIPELFVDIKGDFLNYSLAETNYHLDVSLKTLGQLLPSLMDLIEKEYKLRLMAVEIEKTRRRVNSLEHVTIPLLGKQIKYIKAKLDENALQTTVRLMKMKARMVD